MTLGGLAGLTGCAYEHDHDRGRDYRAYPAGYREGERREERREEHREREHEHEHSLYDGSGCISGQSLDLSFNLPSAARRGDFFVATLPF